MTKPLVAITGASSGIGAATARYFAKQGHPLALMARRQDRLLQLKEELKVPCAIYELDVRFADRVHETIESIENEVGPIEIFVNNAGAGFGLEPAYECNLKEWEECVDVNIMGVLYCTRTVLPYMVKRNKGHIINLGSVAGHYPYPGGNVYGATKAFIEQFSLNLRADLLGKQIRVSCIQPGLTAGTEFSVVRFRGDEKRADSVYANTKPLQAEDIAEVIYFCTSVPPHVNLNTIEVMPVDQAFSPLAIRRNS